MTEEIIIDECFNCKKKKDIGDNWRTCKLKCSYKYKRKENDYITRLEQENKELEIYIESNKQQVEEVETLVMDNNRLQQEVENLKDVIYYDVEKYRSALEEINITVKQLLQGVSSNCINNTPYLTALSLIENKINEVLR